MSSTHDPKFVILMLALSAALLGGCSTPAYQASAALQEQIQNARTRGDHIALSSDDDREAARAEPSA